MNVSMGDFLWTAIHKASFERLEDRLTAEIYVCELDSRLNEARTEEILPDLRGVVDLLEFERVLLHFGDGTERMWRQYLQGIRERKKKPGELKRIDEMVARLPNDDGRLSKDHPIRAVLAATRARVVSSLHGRRPDIGDKRKKQYDRLDQFLMVPATRQWLCRAIRSVLYE